MSKLRAGEVEVVVIEECIINGPDHISLGWLRPGDRVVTHENYLNHLLESGLVCLPHEFDALDTAEAEGTLADLDAELARMVAEQEAAAAAETEPEAELPPETEARVAALEPEAQAKTRENIARVSKAAAAKKAGK